MKFELLRCEFSVSSFNSKIVEFARKTFFSGKDLYLRNQIDQEYILYFQKRVRFSFKICNLLVFYIFFLMEYFDFQACMDVVVNPPKPGEESHASWLAEKETVLASLAERAKLVADTFNGIEGFSCNTVQGAMYAFPQLHLPAKAIAKAKDAGMAADAYYAFQLLENTGICIIPGSGFGQKPGTYHFRTTILPQKDKIISMLGRLEKFHLKFLKEHAD